MAFLSSIRRLKRDSLSPGLKLALVAGLVLHVIGLALVGAPHRLPAPPEVAPPYVRVSGPVLNEQAELLDPGPLFLPGSPVHMRPVGTADAFYVHAADAEEPPLEAPRKGLPAPSAPPLRLVASYPTLSPAYAAAPLDRRMPPDMVDRALTFGRRPLDGLELPPPGPRYEVRDERTGAQVASGTISLSKNHSSAASLRPAVFFLVVDSYGVSPPVSRQGSGDRELDGKLASALVAALAQIPPPEGRYEVVVAP